MIDKIKQWFTRLFVHMGGVPSAPIEISEVNQLINAWLPTHFDLSIPGGRERMESANLELVRIELSAFPVESSVESSTHSESCKERLQAVIDCKFEVTMNSSVVFKTKLALELQADPDYSEEHKSVGVRNAELKKIDFVTGKDSFIKDVSNLANGILPSPLRGLFNVAMASTSVILGDEVVNGMTKYLSLYNSGNQQRIVDYHKKDIENKIIGLTQDTSFRYQLNAANFEEKLFSDYGKKIIVQDGKLLFEF